MCSFTKGYRCCLPASVNIVIALIAADLNPAKINGNISCGKCLFVGASGILFRSCKYSGCGEDCTSFKAASLGLKELSLDVFFGLTSLSELILSDNALASIPPYALAGLAGLNVLDLSGNLLTSQALNIFSGLTNLTTLDLSNNRIDKLPDGIFGGLTGLTLLDLSVNDMDSIQRSAFAGLTLLQSLVLSNNKLSQLPDDVFAGLVGLKVLDLGANQLGPQQTLFSGLAALRDLHLQFNRLLILDPGLFQGLVSLAWLDLHHNRISNLSDGTLRGLKKLERMDLSYNNIREVAELAASLYEIQNLKELYLGGNPLTLRPGSFRNLRDLTLLDIRDSQLTELPPGSFGGLLSLVWLNLEMNRIADIPEDVFTNLISLKVLELDYNLLASVPIDFRSSGLAGLTQLFLSYNQLTTLLNGDFAGLSALNELSLSYNPLAEISASAFEGTLLKAISLLSHYALNLPSDVFAGLNDQAIRVTVSDNACVPSESYPPSIQVCTARSPSR
jgi:Leucine-rich repeat (LRR) protein